MQAETAAKTSLMPPNAAPTTQAWSNGAAHLETVPSSTPPDASTQPAQVPQPLVATATPARSTWTMKTTGVVTDDDLAAMRTGVEINYLWSPTQVRPSVDPSFCDSGCEAEARAAAGMGAIPNAEWQGQFEAARADLADDGEWRTAYLDGLDKAHQYCVFRDQESNALPASHQLRGGSERLQYVGDVNRTLGQGMDQAAARIQLDIQEAQRIDSVRAAMMEVLAERAFNQCAYTPRR